MTSDSAARSVVRRLCWRAICDGQFRRSPGSIVVSSHDTAEEAADKRRERERETWAVVNPFRCGESFFELSSFPAPILYDWLHEIGLEPPPPDLPGGLTAWAEWLDRVQPGLSPDEWIRLRTALDKLRFYETAEQPVGGTLYIVGTIDWRPSDYDYTEYNQEAIFEGIHPQEVTRTRSEAETRRQRFANQLRTLVRHEEHYPPRYSMRGRAAARANPFGPPLAEPTPVSMIEAQFAEIHPVALDADPITARHLERVYLVHRLAWEWDVVQHGSAQADPVWHRLEADPDRIDGVPVAAFATRREAEDLAWDLDFALRSQLNPFRFGPPGQGSSVPELGFRLMLQEAGLIQMPIDWTNWAHPNDWEVAQYGSILAADRWRSWWATHVDGMSARQRETVWDLLDQLRFHTVVELEVVDG